MNEEEEKEEEEEGLFRASAVDEDDPERDRAAPASKVWTTVLRPEGRLTTEEEEGLFEADAVNEEDSERDRATQV